MRTSSPQSGFTLIEALLAAAILTVALLLGVALVLQQPRILRRLDAHREALQEMEAAIESLRTGALPLQTQHLDLRTPDDPTAPLLWITVEPAGYPPGLFRVWVRATWRVEERDRVDQVATMVWRAGM